MLRGETSTVRSLSSLSTTDRLKVLHIQLHSLVKDFQSHDLGLKALISSLHCPNGRNSRVVHTDKYWECKWQIQNVLGNSYIVSNRHLSRWGSSAASIENKLYLFGGRGSDSRPRNSLHVLDLEDFSVSQIRSINLPSGREGHSMMAYKNLLIIFGGCNGGSDDNQSFDDLWIVDVENKTWNKPGVIGKKPQGREGHAAGVIKNQMIIYGGKGHSSLLHDIYAFDMNNFEWKELEQQGQLPGPRESMSSCVVHDCLYVFGGNVSTNPDVDDYNNDLYMISTRANIATSKKLIPSGPLPVKRLSHSMSNLNNLYIILFGGESYGKPLSDVWVFSLDIKQWHEVTPQVPLKGRMTHLCHTFKDTLLVFGGMGEDKIALSELCILQFGNSKKTNNLYSQSKPLSLEVQKSNIPPSYQDFFYCSRCNHDSNSCDFFERSPEIGTPTLNFFAKVQITVNALEGILPLYQDPFAALLRLVELLKSAVIFVKVIGKINLRGGVVCKFPPPDVKIYLSILPLRENDDESEMRQNMLGAWTSNSGTSVNILEIYSKSFIGPEDLVKMCTGSSKLNFISAIFKLSNMALLISRSEELSCVILVHKNEHSIPLYFVVFDQNLEVIYPNKEIVYANTHNIISHSHLNDISEIFAYQFGTSIFVYPEGIDSIDSDLFYQGNSLSALLGKVSDVKYILQDNPISFEESNKIQKNDTHLYMHNIIDSAAFSILVYYKKKLIYWEFKQSGQNKRSREECSEIKLKDKTLVSAATGRLEWNIKTMQMFSDIIPNNKRIPKDPHS